MKKKINNNKQKKATKKMNKSKSIKPTKKITKSTEEPTNTNTNTNNIKINIGSTTKQTRRNNNNNKSYGTSKNIQNTSAPYPVYNQARQSGYPSSSTTIINPPQLQPQNNFTQKDLTNIKDEILAKLNQPLQTAIGYDPDFQNISNDIQDLKDAHRKGQQERQFEREQKEMRRREKEIQRENDLKDRDNFYEYINKQNQGLNKSLFLLEDNLNKDNEQRNQQLDYFLNNNNSLLTNNDGYKNPPSSPFEMSSSYDNTNAFEGTNPMLDQNTFDEAFFKNNSIPQPSTNNVIEPDNKTDDNIANQFLKTSYDRNTNTTNINVNAENIAKNIDKNSFNTEAMKVKQQYTMQDIAKLKSEYIDLYKKFYSVEDIPEEELKKLDKYDKPQSVGNLTKMNKSLNKKIAGKQIQAQKAIGISENKNMGKEDKRTIKNNWVRMKNNILEKNDKIDMDNVRLYKEALDKKNLENKKKTIAEIEIEKIDEKIKKLQGKKRNETILLPSGTIIKDTKKK